MVWVFLISFLITNFMVPNLLLVSLKKRLLDIPNMRSVHKVASSRLGGVSFLPSLLLSICSMLVVWKMTDDSFISSRLTVEFIIVIGACGIMYVVGLFDDLVGLRFKFKFVAQFIAALLIVASGVYVDNLHGFVGVNELTPWLAVPLSILLIMFIMNAINLIDGIDGLASGLSMIALLVYGVYFVCIHFDVHALISFAMFGCLLAFFRYNVRGFAHKTLKIFMGDTGSLVTGTVLGICAIKLTQYDEVNPNFGDFQLLIAYSVLIVPCFDVFRVMISRKRKGKSMFLPDKTHIHHKLLSLGLSARRSMVTILLISILFLLLNVVLYPFIPMEMIVLLDVLLFTILNVWISYMIVKKKECMPLNGGK